MIPQKMRTYPVPAPRRSQEHGAKVTVSKTSAGDGLERQVALGYILIAAMALLVFGWAAFSNISAAIVGAGRVIVAANEKLVQHPTGGVVGAINVKEGSRVREGDIVMRLDDTAVRAGLNIVVSELSAARARLARLQAERDHMDTVIYPVSMTTSPTAADREAMASEARFFASRREARENQKDQLRKRMEQARQQIKGYDLLVKSRQTQLDLARQQLETTVSLKAKRLVTASALTDQQQSVARLEGEYGSYLQQIAATKAQVTENEVQIAGVDQNALTDVMKDLRDTEAKIEEYQAREIAARDQLQKADIRAPADGVVHELAVHTVRGVVNPGEAIMKIVPDNSKLQYEVKISPNDIDQVLVGQAVRLRFSAFNRAHSPEVTGKIAVVGADASIDKQSGHSYYEVLVDPDPDTDAKLKEKGVSLVPGMPVEAFMQTGDRSVLSYLLKPFTDQVNHAFREE